MAQPSPSLSVKSRETILITAIAIVAASLIYFVWPGVGQKPEISQELILGQVISQKNNFNVIAHRSVNGVTEDVVMKADFKSFAVSQSLQELLNFYKTKLSVDGWTIITESQAIRDGISITTVLAENYSTNQSITISIFPRAENGNGVEITLRNGVLSRKLI